MVEKEILELLRGEISKDEYARYISNLKLDEQETKTDVIVFNTSNVFMANWIKQKYVPIMSKIIESKTRSKPTIKIEVKSLKENIKLSNKKKVIKQDKLIINTTFTFDTFVIGECNNMSYRIAYEVGRRQGVAFNPVLIYGSTGLGKTHLLNAIANYVLENNPSARIIYLTAEMFLNDYTQKIEIKGAMNEFRKTYRNCDYLLIDDIQFFGGKEKIQEEFFHTFEDLIRKQKQIVMTSDKPPKDIVGLQERLRSRFEGGANTKISSPEITTKINIIKDKCKLNKITISDEIIEYLAKNIGNNIRQIEGIITKLQAQSSLLDIKISMPIAENAIRDINTESKTITLDRIIDEVAKCMNVKPSEIRSKSRRGMISKARKVTVFIARKHTQKSTPEIAKELGLKDHSSVSKQLKAIERQMEKERELSGEIRAIVDRIKSM